MVITPAILTNSFEDFAHQLKRADPSFDYVHIDVMDGQFVKNTSFQDIEKINSIKTKLKFELHLMAEHPIEEMIHWKSIKNIFRVLCHMESLDSPEECIEFAKGEHWEVGLVLNPDTALHRAESYFNLIDVVQFMTVYPGRQGAPFIPETEQKIKSFTKLKQRPECAVDGSVNKETIGLLKSWGVEICNVGSALVKAQNIEEAYKELHKIINPQLD
jgi:ribulose-phosphate 3-epimerase